MIDLTKAAEPKSDQLNADDLIGGSKRLKITSVEVKAGEQPVTVHYDGEDGRPFKPCKSMVRVMVAMWGKDGSKYVGHELIVYCDDRVKWAGTEVGGIRISHMSHIKKDAKMMITVSRGKKLPYTIERLITEPEKELSADEYKAFEADIKAAENMEELQAVGKRIGSGGYSAESVRAIKDIYRTAVKELGNK